MRAVTGLVIGIATILFVWNSAAAQQKLAGREVSLSLVNDQDKDDAFCRSHHLGPELEGLTMTGHIGKDFIAGDVEEINGTKLIVKLLQGDITQSVEVADKTIVCLQRGNEALKSIPLGDVKPGYHVFGSGKVNHGVFVVRKVLYVQVFEDKAAPQ